MKMRGLIFAAACAFLAASSPAAKADLGYTQGGASAGQAAVIFDFLCFTTKHCSAHVNINSAGTEIFTAAAPGQVTGANGTFPATQSGTWTVQPGNTANTTPWLVTGTGGTFPATQSGTWSSRLQDGSGNLITSAARGSERAASVQIVDGSGNQITSFGGSGGTASNFTSAFPASGTSAGFSDGTNMQGARVFDGDSGAGTQYVLGSILRKSASGGTVEAGTSSDPLRVDPTGTTTQPVSVANGSSVALGATSDAACSTDSGTCTLLALIKRTNQNLTSGLIPTGTAGTPATAVLTVQGIASMTKLLVTPDSVALPANQSVNVSQINGVTALMGNGATGTGSPRVTLSNDNTIPTGWPTAANQTAAQGATGAAVPASAVYQGVKVGANIVGQVGDPCQVNAASYAPISITTATTTRIITPSTSNRTYICYMLLISAAADNVGIVEGTGGTCGTGTAGVVGGTTAANGPNFAANGGVSLGNGSTAVLATTGTNVDFCLITSAATPLAGHVKYVQAP